MKRSLFFVAAFAVLIGMAAAPVHADKDINPAGDRKSVV